MTLVTHCPCAHKDAVFNATSTVCDESRTAVQALLRPKGESTAAEIGAMRVAVAWDGSEKHDDDARRLPVIFMYDVSAEHSGGAGIANVEQLAARKAWREVTDALRGSESDAVMLSLFVDERDVDFVDEAGFDGLDRLFLTTLVEKFGGGPVGLDTLAAAVGEDKGTLEDVVEPYLIHCGFLTRTPRGRVATERALAHLGQPAAGG